jgi:riboflavin kinase / FMN adenylyltransferase
MQILESAQLDETPRSPSVVTLGKFDGVHRGHQRLIDRVAAEARRLGALSVVIALEKDANRAGETGPITSFGMKERLVKERGVDMLVSVTRDSEWLQMDARAFILEVLVKRIRMVKIVTGPDFRFGRNRLGGVKDLHRLGMESGFEVETIPFVRSGERRISSSRIRSLLWTGDFNQAARMLGREPIPAN